LLLTSDVGWRKRHGDKETEPPLPQAATTRHIQVNHLPADSIPIHIKDALTSIDAASLMRSCIYDYDSERDAHHYILVLEVKYCRDTDPAQQRERASQQHQVLRETIIHNYAPQATVEQVTLLLGVSGAIYTSTMDALKDKLEVTQPRLNVLSFSKS
jgi:hypothetical protein